MELYSDLMKKSDHKKLSKEQWEDVLAKTPSDCGGKKLKIIQ
jgi:hypothetical protein